MFHGLDLNILENWSTVNDNEYIDESEWLIY